MKNLYNIFYFLMLAGVILFAACDDDGDSFEGKDNYITSFSLVQGTITLEASIAEGVITVKAPDNLTLAGAKANVKLSENAKISPDPASITNWDEEVQFTITSYNGTKASYKYTVDRQSIDDANTIVLETQAEVDAFGARGITSIGGNLVIGRPVGLDSIRSLAPLAQLKNVGYSLIIYPTYASASLTGLDNLENIGNTLQIEDVKYLTSASLPKLKTVGGISIRNSLIQIANFPELTAVNQTLSLECPLGEVRMPNLVSVKGALHLSTTSNSKAIMKQISLPKLEELGDLNIYYFQNLTKIDFPVLKTMRSNNFLLPTLLGYMNFPKLETITGTFTVPNASPLSEVSFPSLVSADGIVIDGKKVRVLDFPKLTSVTQKLMIQNIPTSDIDKAFPVLTKVEGELQLRELANLKELKLPAQLKTIGKLSLYNRTSTPISEINIKGINLGELSLMANASRGTKLIGDAVYHGTLSIITDGATSPYPTFPTLDGFSEVDSLSFGTYISYMTDLNIKGIKKINKGLTIPNNSLISISISDLEEVGGSFTLNTFNNTIMTDETLDVPSLKSIGGDLSIAMNSVSIRTLKFSNLSSVGKNFTIGTGYSDMWSGNREFSSLLFPALKTIGNNMKIFVDTYSNKNTTLKNLDGFAALENVKGITVENQTALVSYEGLKKAMSSFPANSWITNGNSYNPTYDDLKAGKWVKP